MNLIPGKRTTRVLGLMFVVLVAQVVVLRPAEAAEKAKITVLSIEATKSDDGKGVIDRGLKALAEQLKKAVPYDSFHLLSQKSQSGAYGEKQTFKLPEKMELLVTPTEKTDGSIRLTVLLYGPDPKSGKKKQILPKLSVTVQRKKGIPIAGPKLKDGGVLVIVVSAE